MSPHDEDRKRQLPPPVLRRRKKQPAKRARAKWHRHLPWLIPLGACVVFGVLIGGSLGVRQVIVVLRGEPVGANDRADGSAAEGDAAGDTEAGTAGRGATSGSMAALLESSEPGYKVLPPKAAIEPGRKLPKMLLVGTHPEMFPTLEAAVAAAVPGDIIEIRTDGPLLVEPVERTFAAAEIQRPITIRAGAGFAPVLRPAFRDKEKGVFRFAAIDLQMAGLHVASITPGKLITCTGGRLTFEGCTFTAAPPAKSLLVVDVTADRSKGGAEITFRRCLLRNIQAVRSVSPAARVEIADSAISYSHPLVDFRLAEDQSLVLKRSTMVGSYLLRLNVEDETWPARGVSFTMEQSLFGMLACCPQFLLLNVPHAEQVQTVADAEALLPRAVSVFDAGNNVAQFWEGWAGVNMPGRNFFIKRGVLTPFPPIDNTMGFGPRFEQMRTLIHQQNSPPQTRLVAASVLPADFAATSSGPLAAARAAGRDYGCDVSKLPVPPATTVEPYELPPAPQPKNR